MNLKNLFNNLVVFIAMYGFLLFLITAGQDIITPILKDRKLAKDQRITSPVYTKDQNPAQIYKDIAKAKNTYMPYTGWRHKPYQSKNVNIDKTGNRTHTLNPANTKRAKSVGFFGASAMWGVGVKDDQTIPAHFDKLTADFKAINYGERGYTSRQNLARLVNLINQNKMPDIVVFHDGFADIWALCNNAVTSHLNGHIQERKITAAVVSQNENSKFYNTFIAPLVNIAVKIGGKKKWAKKLACTTTPERGKLVASTLAANWQMAKTLVEANGGKFIAILQPNAYVTQSDVKYLNLNKSKKSRAIGNEIKHMYPLILQALKQKPSLPVYDFSTLFDQSTMPLFIDAAHLSSNGNKIQAMHILKLLTTP